MDHYHKYRVIFRVDGKILQCQVSLDILPSGKGWGKVQLDPKSAVVEVCRVKFIERREVLNWILDSIPRDKAENTTLHLGLFYQREDNQGLNSSMITVLLKLRTSASAGNLDLAGDRYH